MAYGSGPAPYGGQPPYGGQAPYGAGPAPYGVPNQFGQFGAPALTPDVAPLPGASFGDAVKRFFQRYAQFRGYASPSEFWWAFLFVNIVVIAAYLMLIAAIGAVAWSADSSSESAGGILALFMVGLFFVALLAVSIPYLALMVRRLHDTGKSGLFLLFALIGLGIVPFILCCFESRPDLYRPEWS